MSISRHLSVTTAAALTLPRAIGTIVSVRLGEAVAVTRER